jgi:hypothetical protein
MLSVWARGLSFVDIHLYPTRAYNIDADLASSEFSYVPKTTPLLLGEFGPDLLEAPSIAQTATALGRLRSNAYERGFLGSLLWTWLAAGQNGGAINGVLAPLIRATASSSAAPTHPYLAFDGDAATAWNSGGFAPKWIQIDLGRTRSISKIMLTPSQSPSGATVHEISGGTDLSGMTLLSTINQYTESGRTIELNVSPRALRYIRIVTKVSPSWVAWQEIAVQDVW